MCLPHSWHIDGRRDERKCMREALIPIPGSPMVPNMAHTAGTVTRSVGNREQTDTGAWTQSSPLAQQKAPEGASTDYKCTRNQRKQAQVSLTTAAPSRGKGTAWEDISGMHSEQSGFHQLPTPWKRHLENPSRSGLNWISVFQQVPGQDYPIFLLLSNQFSRYLNLPGFKLQAFWGHC